MHWAYDAALALRYRNGCRTLVTLGLSSNITWVTGANARRDHEVDPTFIGCRILVDKP